MTTRGPDDPGAREPQRPPADQSVHEAVGAYAIGVLDADEAAAFEEHLAGCERCAAMLEELVGLGPLLAQLADLPAAPDTGDDTAGRAVEVAARPGPRLVDRVLVDVAAHRARRRRRARYLVGVAAALIIAGPLTTLAVSGPADDDRRPVADRVALQRMTEKTHATDARTKVSATIGVEHRPWGTDTLLELRNVKGPFRCSLVAVGKDGSRETMSSWQVPRWGYGVPDSTWPGARDPLYVRGSAALDAHRIDHFEVLTFDGKRLVTLAPRSGS